MTNPVMALLSLAGLCAGVAVPDPQSLLPKKLPCTLNNIALVGGDLTASDGGGGIPTGEDPAECKFECERRANCQFWTHVREWDVNCFLKSVAGEERPMDAAVTGWKGDGCAGGTEAFASAPSPAAATPTPRLSSRIRAEQRRRQELEERRRQGLLDNTGCKLEDVALLGADLPRDLNGDGVSLRSFVECRQACRDQDGCEAFTFVKEWELNCFLKSKKGEESEFLGAVSGTLEPCSSALEQQIAISNARGRRPQAGDQQRRRRPVAASTDVPVSPAAPSRSRLPVRSRRPRPPPPPPPPPSRPEVVFPSSSSTQESECIFQATNFLGGGLEKEEGGQGIEVSDQESCSAECQKRPKCNYWTYVKKWKVSCYLKGRLGEKSDFEGGISGTYGHRCDELETSPSAPTRRLPTLDPSTAGSFSSLQPGSPNECLFDNTNFLGGGLTEEEGGQGIETKGYQACSLECQTRPKCNYWTFVEKWKVNCYLKSRLGEKSEFEGGVSGTYSEHCEALQPSKQQRPRSPSSASSPLLSQNVALIKQGEECIYQNTNFLGGGLPENEGGQGIQTKDFHECDQECRNRGRCQYWTFVEKWQINCYLKSHLGEKTEFEGGVSGTYGANCNFGARSQAPSSSSPSSSSFSSSHLGAAVNGKVSDGGGCRYLSVNLQGGDLSPDKGGHGIETRDPDHCRNECAERGDCQFWTFVSEWKVNCYLKDKKGAEREMEGATSGALLVACDEELKDELGETGEPRDNEHECAYDGLTFNGADLPAKEGGLGIVTGTAERCRGRCLESRYCYHWVHQDGWRVNCYLKGKQVFSEEKEGSVSGSIGVRCLSGATSLPSPSSSSSLSEVPRSASINFQPAILVRPTNNRKDHCRYPGLNYQGGDLADSQGGNGIETKTAGQCAAECERRPECQFWTHVDGWKVGCYLKSTFDNQSQKDGATSGSIGVACDEDFKASPPSEEEVDPAAVKAAPAQAPSSLLGGGGGSNASNKVPRSPSSQPDNVCFFTDVNVLGGDLPKAAGGEGVSTPDVNNCAVACYEREDCVYFVWVHGWGERNCFLKSHFTDEEAFPGSTSGSIGLACVK